MRYTPEAAADDWVLYELVDRGKRPCSDKYAKAKDDDLSQIFGELRLLRAAGVPPDRTKGNPDVQAWSAKCRGQHQKTTFYVLKAKPTGWRLYFEVVDAQRRQLVFLYAVNKKKNDRDQKDFDKLCRLRDRLASDSSEVAVALIDIPPR